MWRKGNPSALLVGMQIGEATVEKSMEFPHTKNGTKTKNGKLKMELLFVPAIPLLGLYPKNPETPIQKNLCIPMFIGQKPLNSLFLLIHSPHLISNYPTH